MGALYIGFQAFVIPWQAGGGRFIAAFSFLDNFFVLGIPHVFFVFGCSLSWCHPWQSQFIASPFGQRHQRDNSATAPRLGKNNPSLFLILWFSPCSLG